MEKIFFDEDTFIWKTKLYFVNKKDSIMSNVNDIININSEIKTDNYKYKKSSKSFTFDGALDVKNELDEIINKSIELCKELYGKEYNQINYACWINVIRSINPVQIQFKHKSLKDVNKYHIHTDIQKQTNMFYPNFTWVYYVQMPDVMEGEDGVLYIKGMDEKEYWIRPEEDDLIIMMGDLPHAPNNSPKAKINRIVLAGNVGFEYIKNKKSII